MHQQRGVPGKFLPRRASLPPEDLARLQQGTGSSSRQRSGSSFDYRQVDTEEPADLWPSRIPSSVRRYHPTNDHSQVIIQGNRRFVLHDGLPPTQARQYQQRYTDEEKSAVALQGRMHWFFYMGLLILVMLIGFVLLSAFLNWWQVYQDDLHYGRPRTYQIDQRVGHNDDQTPSHFIAINLNHHALVIECPGGDCTKAVVYEGPQLYGDGDDLAPITLSFKTVKGTVYMLMHVANQTFVFISDNGKFRPLRSDEYIPL